MFNFGPINFQDLANGILILVIGLVSALGIRGGGKARKSAATAEPETETLQLAGAVIDSKKADELIGSFKINTASNKRLADSLDRNTAAQDRNATAQARLGGQLDALRDDTVDLKGSITSLTNEVIRSGKN